MKYTDDELNSIINIEELNNNFIKKIGNCHLTQNEINILNRYNINYMKCLNDKDLLFEIEEYLEVESNNELEWLSSSIAERSYYIDTNK